MSHRPVDIVVADDDALVVGELSEILKECGFSVRIAADGLEALTEIRNRMPDILLSDLNIPRMSGFELLSIVRRRYSKIKVIAMSRCYPWEIVPQGVAADGFYEKSGTSIAQLLLIVNGMKDEPESQLMRASAPIWIPRPSAISSRGSSVSFACPECLRAYACALDDSGCMQSKNCPFCNYSVQLATFPGNLETATPPLIYYYS